MLDPAEFSAINITDMLIGVETACRTTPHLAPERSFGVGICYDTNEPRGRSGFHSRPFAFPAAQNTGSVLLGIVL